MKEHKPRRRIYSPPEGLIDLSKFKITTHAENVSATEEIIRDTIEKYDKSNSKKDSK